MRDAVWEIAEIGRTRSNQEKAITLETPYYDIVRIKAEESEEVRLAWRDRAWTALRPEDMNAVHDTCMG